MSGRIRLTLGAVAILVAGVPMVSCASQPASGQGTASADNATGGTPETDDQRVLYALGQALGQNITNASLTADEMTFVVRGLTDAASGAEPLVSLDEYGPRLQAFMQQRAAAAAEVELGAATAFLEERAAVDGATRTDSGIVVREIAAGDGASPTAQDTVRVHYHGTLRDGTVFDSSVERNEPATFPLGNVIPCWTEGLQLMKVGGKSELVCPPDLAYGPDGRPGIPGNAALAFEVELLEVVAN